MVDKLFVATKAFVIHDGKVLLLKESAKYIDGSNSGKFDVVGGRVSPGERFDKSLLREVKEEIGLTVTIGKPFYVSEWRPHVRGEQWQIIGIFFECLTDSSKVVLSEDHSDSLWINPSMYKEYNLIEGLGLAFERYLET